MDTYDKENVILEQLKSDDIRAVNQGIAQLYRNFYPGIKSYILKNSGTLPEAEDVFQETVAIVYEKVNTDGFEIKVGLGQFLFGVARNVWYKALTKKNKMPLKDITDSWDNMVIEELDRDYEEDQRLKLIIKLVSDLSDDCRKVLTLFYFEKLSMSEIAHRMGYASEQVAKNKKYKCLEALRKKVKTSKIMRQLVD